MPLIEKFYPGCDEEQIPDLSIKIATAVQDYINKSYDLYAENFHMIKTHRWKIKQELIASRAFWGSAKKRYAMWLVRDGGKVVDKSDIKGFDSVRSSFPKVFRRLLKDVIELILKDANPIELNEYVMDFKSKLNNYPLYEIMNPTSVKDMEKYQPTRLVYNGKDDEGRQKYKEIENTDIRYKKGTPIHIKSARNYNSMKELLSLMSTPNIQSGDKILWAYLQQNPYDFDTIALFGYDDPEEIVTFVTQYIHRDKIFDRALGGKLQDLWDDLGWGKLVMNPNVSKIFDFS